MNRNKGMNQAASSAENNHTVLLTEDGFPLSEEQAAVFHLLDESDENFFVTGKAGTGKSVVLRYFIQNARKRNQLAVVAPTGIAAIEIGGSTIHSFFGLAPQVQDVHDQDQLKLSPKKEEVLAALKVIIIDEISMVRSDLMDMIDHKMRLAKHEEDVPFGGCQMIVFGDLYQLPPVNDTNEQAQNFIEDTYHSLFFFSTPGYQHKPFRIVELQEVHRQKESEFTDILNEIRTGNADNDLLQKLNARHIQPQNDDYIALTPTRNAASRINSMKLKELTSKEYTYTGMISGNFKPEEIPNQLRLRLKVGAHVMMLKNDPEKRWVNGSGGVVAELGEDYLYVRMNKDGRIYPISQETWTKYEYLYDEEKRRIEHVEVGSFKQYPVMLAWAITIHKSQGQSFDKVMIDYSMGGAFSSGQTYVALSRCKSLSGLYLKRELLASDIKANQEVIHFMNSTKSVPEPANSGKITWLPSKQIQIVPSKSPKKITGRRLAAILGMDRYKTPFAAWCEITRTYEKPFVPNKYTEAGEIIEPKQAEYLRGRISSSVGCVVAPQDIFPPESEQMKRKDFFGKDSEPFGGMWDYLLESDDIINGVFEMKTTNVKNRSQWQRCLPEQNILQAALYAYLLGIDDIYMISSFIEDENYDHPDDFQCSDSNTMIRHICMSESYPDFENKYIQPALKWWKDHVETGISPVYHTIRDGEILSELRRTQEENQPRRNVMQNMTSIFFFHRRTRDDDQAKNG